MSTTTSDSSTRPLNKSTRDDSAYGGQKFDVERAKVDDADVAPEMQLNRKGVGKFGHCMDPQDWPFECMVSGAQTKPETDMAELNMLTCMLQMYASASVLHALNMARSPD